MEEIAASLFADRNEGAERESKLMWEREQGEFLLEAQTGSSFRNSCRKGRVSEHSCRRWVDTVSQVGVGGEGLFWWLPLSQ